MKKVCNTRLKTRELRKNIIMKVPIILDSKRGTLLNTFTLGTENITSIDWAEDNFMVLREEVLEISVKDQSSTEKKIAPNTKNDTQAKSYINCDQQTSENRLPLKEIQNNTNNEFTEIINSKKKKKKINVSSA
ncbi:21038_t:CDS:2 [Cetraspora pellucida]|uniref:21038_t:CDS:1 n=1 Tax=Cetraspora pellucida TaxID=1433469 RepID=A0A9N8VKM0_9GLOM|nr:21038_t:CDS:2 [Cetraspora pellucida]